MKEIEPERREPSPFTVQALQIGVALAISFATIYVSRQLEYPINGAIIGAWAFMGAYAATWLLFKVIDVRRYGWTALPPKPVMWSVGWKIVAVTIGYLAVGIIRSLVIFWLN